MPGLVPGIHVFVLKSIEVSRGRPGIMAFTPAFDLPGQTEFNLRADGLECED
jgi:hypothetical protein